MTKKETRIPIILGMLDRKKTDEIPDFVTRLYLGKLDEKIDTILLENLGDNPLKYLYYMAIEALNSVNGSKIGDSAEMIFYKIQTDYYLPYFETSHFGYTRLLGYFYRSMLKDLTKTKCFELAKALDVSPLNLYKWAIREKEKYMDPTLKEKAKEMLGFLQDK